MFTFEEFEGTDIMVDGDIKCFLANGCLVSFLEFCKLAMSCVTNWSNFCMEGNMLNFEIYSGLDALSALFTERFF